MQAVNNIFIRICCLWSVLNCPYIYMVLCTSLHFATIKITIQTSTTVKTHISYEWNEVDNIHTPQGVHFKHHADCSIFGIISTAYVMKCCNILFWNILNVPVIYWSILKYCLVLWKVGVWYLIYCQKVFLVEKYNMVISIKFLSKCVAWVQLNQYHMVVSCV